MEKVLSGIEGFDTLLGGGFPKGRSYLVSGEPGTGKTLFTLQFLLQGLRNGEKAIFITIDEKPEHLIADAIEIGWEINQYLENGSLQIIDVSSYFTAAQLGSYDGINVKKIIDDIISYIQQSGAARLAIDPIAPLIFTDQPVPEVVEYIRQLIFALEQAPHCTTLLTSYSPVGSDKISHHGIEEFASSGIILLRLQKTNNKYIRTIRVRKLRGSKIDLTEYSFEILPQRGLVLRQPV